MPKRCAAPTRQARGPRSSTGGNQNPSGHHRAHRPGHHPGRHSGVLPGVVLGVALAVVPRWGLIGPMSRIGARERGVRARREFFECVFADGRSENDDAHLDITPGATARTRRPLLPHTRTHIYTSPAPTPRLPSSPPHPLVYDSLGR